MAPTVLLDSPLDGATVSLPITVQGTVAPPGAVFALWDDSTGMFLGAVQSDGSGHAQLVVNSLLVNGPRWVQSESSSGSRVAISTNISVTSAACLSVALATAQAGISAGVSGHVLSQMVATAVATWKAGVGGTGLSASRSTAMATATMTAALVQAQLATLGASASSALAAVLAGMSANGLAVSASSSVATATMTAASPATNVSDNFTRSNSANLGANWTKLPSATLRWSLGSNTAVSSAGAGQDCGDYWSANSFNGNHYSENTLIAACAVRMQSGARSCYYVRGDMTDLGDSYLVMDYALLKVVAGSHTGLGSWRFDNGGDGSDYPGVFRLEANGTTVAFKTAPSHGGTLTTRISVTDSSLSGGAPGLYMNESSNSADDWYGGDL